MKPYWFVEEKITNEIYRELLLKLINEKVQINCIDIIYETEKLTKEEIDLFYTYNEKVEPEETFY